MTRLLANTLGPDIRVNAVAPGLVDTPWTADWTVVREFVTAQAPLQRSATPEDVAEVILGLARSTYVTGEVVLVDGGLPCGAPSAGTTGGRTPWSRPGPRSPGGATARGAADGKKASTRSSPGS